MSDLEQSLRIYNNILALLTQGHFPGEVAPHISEALEFVTNIKQTLEGQIDDQEEDTPETDHIEVSTPAGGDEPTKSTTRKKTRSKSGSKKSSGGVGRSKASGGRRSSGKQRGK